MRKRNAPISCLISFGCFGLLSAAATSRSMAGSGSGTDADESCCTLDETARLLSISPAILGVVGIRLTPEGR